MQIYKFSLMEKTGFSTSGSGFEAVRIISDNLVEAEKFLWSIYRKKDWTVHSIDTFEIKKGPIY